MSPSTAKKDFVVREVSQQGEVAHGPMGGRQHPTFVGLHGDIYIYTVDTVEINT